MKTYTIFVNIRFSTWSRWSGSSNIRSAREVSVRQRDLPESSYCKQDKICSKRDANHDCPPAFIGRDHPVYLPVKQKQVLVTREDSVRYSISDPEAEEEWLWTGPVGDHNIRLGKDYRGFAVSMFHELHCLRIMRRTLNAGDYQHLSRAQKGHIHHCFVYLRLWTLCSADVALEPGDFAHRNFTTERMGATHTCTDWDPAYELVNDRFITWDRYRREMGIPEPTE